MTGGLNSWLEFKLGLLASVTGGPEIDWDSTRLAGLTRGLEGFTSHDRGTGWLAGIHSSDRGT